MTKIDRREEKALKSAYVKGQTDLDGWMVTGATSRFVKKERAPWAQ